MIVDEIVEEFYDPLNDDEHDLPADEFTIPKPESQKKD